MAVPWRRVRAADAQSQKDVAPVGQGARARNADTRDGGGRMFGVATKDALVRVIEERRIDWCRPMGQRAADSVHDPGIVLHEDLWPDARAIGDGLGRAARMGGKEPAFHLQDASASRASRGCLAMTWR